MSALSLAEMRAKIAARAQAPKEEPKLEAVPSVEPEVTEEPKAEPKTEPKPETPKALVTREQWLESASSVLRKYFQERKSVLVPNFRVSVGFPRGKRDTGALVGQTVAKENTSDGLAQVFITPRAETSWEALRILVEEMGAVTEPRKKTALAIRFGLAHDTGEVSDELDTLFDAIESQHGAYPHAAVKASAHTPRDSAQTKVYCEKTGYKARIAQSWLTKYGAPTCACCSKQMKVEE